MRIQNSKTPVHVGTSGWNYPHWRRRFYPDHLAEDQWLKFYAHGFDTVEVNNTFYHLPKKRVFEDWRRGVPDGFCFAVKASRYITHLKKLKDPREPLQRFLTRVRHLGPRLGPVLYQLPPHWRPNPDRLNDFCRELPRDIGQVIEFRDREWLNDEVYAILSEHRIGLCIHDMLKRHPRRITGPLLYVRLHGAGTKYGGSYSGRRLGRWADWFNEVADEVGAIHVYFNNDQNGHAVRNARRLRDILCGPAESRGD